MRQGLKIMGLVLLTLLLVVALTFLWASSGDAYSESPEPGLLLKGPGRVAPPVAPTALTVMSFNIGYGRGPAGDYVGPWTRAHVEQHLSGVADQIAASGADLACLQEVDLAAARSHGIDEAAFLLEKLGWGHGSCVVTWQKNWIPFPYWPFSKQYGGMKSGSCVLSRFPLTRSVRHPLPQPEQPWWRNRFYFQRALDQVTVVVGSAEWTVFNVHLEAFDLPNRHAHAEVLRAAIAAVPDQRRVIVAGDFNAIPEAAEPRKGYADEPEMDFTGDRTLALATAGLPLVEAFADVAEPAFSFPADAPSRRLDYIFHGRAATTVSARVLGAPPGPWSDHLPLLARLRLIP
jgi:endonuclease/exonuclease/phosphatase family metal-dependent hydrolase